ncbi:Gfo/Idh/MocA family oxidoreductase [Vibrio sp. S9_S30]|nr:Gfo/Idh/MocA family oxidoreductase [Vibrio sp. S9_S30]
MSLSIQKLGRKLRLAVIGGGPDSFIGSIHRSAATMHEEFDVVAGVLSSSPERSLQAAKSLGIRGYESADALFSQEKDRKDGADVVAIMTPNNTHYTLSLRALEMGFHVMCEKPLTMTEEEAKALILKAKQSKKCYCVAYGYTGYPMVRQARAMIKNGMLGDIKMLQSHYIQGHLAELTPSELDGSNWHMKPELAGPSLILGDIATHSYHLLSYVSGMLPEQVSADVTALVDGRQADDYCGVQLRYSNQARGQLFVTQAAAGGVHGLSFKIYGTKGGIEWNQEQPNELLVRPLDAPAYVLTKGGTGLLPEAQRVSHVAIGHPEGYREAFANLYFDLAHHIVAIESGEDPNPMSLEYPTVEEGAEGMAFVFSALQSRDANSQWVTLGLL